MLACFKCGTRCTAILSTDPLIPEGTKLFSKVSISLIRLFVPLRVNVVQEPPSTLCWPFLPSSKILRTRRFRLTRYSSMMGMGECCVAQKRTENSHFLCQGGVWFKNVKEKHLKACFEIIYKVAQDFWGSIKDRPEKFFFSLSLAMFSWLSVCWVLTHGCDGLGVVCCKLVLCTTCNQLTFISNNNNE